MMHMWFWFGTDLGSFLFYGYKVTSTIALVATCVGLVALAILYEAMKTLQFKLHRITKASFINKNSNNTESSSLLYHLVPKLPNFSNPNWRKIGYWIAEVAHYSTHTIIGYMLMLAVMTYNGYICIALVIGSTIGYWIFSPALLNLNMAELREKYNSIPCDPVCADAVINSERRQSAVSIVAEQLVSEINAEIHAVSNA
ncbi:hypothetical protein PV328_005442 [Microctonus aethiopoides]|uniref:Copper transport protein n=1 Tax=Microctonus aethiopoides TaxID=144406 RepID=A0AA39KSG5_9HYME|nr:hypothetical protein PV328_005442 [Microctonus aethiopoides]